MPSFKKIDVAIGGNATGLGAAVQQADGYFARLDAKIKAVAVSTKESFKLGAIAQSALAFGAAISAADIAAKLLKGKFDELDQVIERLPFGLGRVVQVSRDFLGEITGINDEIATLNKQTELSNKLTEIGTQQWKLRADSIRQNNKQAGETAFKASQTFQVDPAKTRLQIQHDADRQVQSNNEKLQTSSQSQKDLLAQRIAEIRKNTTVSKGELDAAFTPTLSPPDQFLYKHSLAPGMGPPPELEGQLRQQKIDQAIAQEQTRSNKIIADMRRAAGRDNLQQRILEANQIASLYAKTFGDEVKATFEYLAKITDAQKKARDEHIQREQEVTDAETEMKAKGLELQHKDLEAREVRVKASYAKRIDKAKKAGEAEQVARLKALQTQELDQAKKEQTNKDDSDVHQTLHPGPVRFAEGTYLGDASGSALQPGMSRRERIVAAATRQDQRDPLEFSGLREEREKKQFQNVDPDMVNFNEASYNRRNYDDKDAGSESRDNKSKADELAPKQTEFLAQAVKLLERLVGEPKIQFSTVDMSGPNGLA